MEVSLRSRSLRCCRWHAYRLLLLDISSFAFLASPLCCGFIRCPGGLLWHICANLWQQAFVILRNATAGLQSKYSKFFAECGKISLELFLAQYHAWLALDTKGLLVLIPGFPILNALICSVMFMVISRQLSSNFNHLVAIILPKDIDHFSLVLRTIGFAVLLGFTSYTIS
eukprot:m.118211 g.118211  ORF g.118211 m.118211 type:complete len:170 (+) comp15446_c0_seq2:2199-2708(+)